MNRRTEVIKNQLLAAISCVHELEEKGVIIQDVLVGCKHPLVTVVDPDHALHGAAHVRKGESGESVMVTTVRGCQVQWMRWTDRRARKRAAQS